MQLLLNSGFPYRFENLKFHNYIKFSEVQTCESKIVEISNIKFQNFRLQLQVGIFSSIFLF